MQTISGIAIHIIISIAGIWYVNIVVKLQSDGELLDSVDDSIMLVEPQSFSHIVYENLASKKL